jgi:outer membrane protein insertion porin family
VRLSFFSGSIIRDTRDDPVNPGAGRYVSANAALAARRIGSEVGFAKSFFTAQAFHTLSGGRRIVLAAAGRLGLATAFSSDNVAEGEGDLPASERFYAGGDTTVRGFALDQLGVRHSPPLPSDTLDSANFPLGGNGLVIMNGEARVPIRGGFGLVGFMDIGNVFKSPSDIDLSELRAGVGFGIRYRSPIGPIRVDLGFKMRPRDFGEAGRESVTALHISLGQAF